MQTKIAKIGFEIEAEWSDQAKAIFDGYGEIKGDGSIHRCQSYNGENTDHHKCTLEALEFASNPLEFNPALLDELKKKFERLQKHYDAGRYHFNKSMGMHIHLSFNNEHPPELISPKFVAYFKKAIQRELPSVFEARQHNNYCKFRIPASELLQGNRHDRYRFINIWPAMSRHNTIEIRAYPSEQPMEMYRYLRFTFKTINEFIAKGQKIKTKCELTEPTAYNREWNDEQAEYEKPELNITFEL